MPIPSISSDMREANQAYWKGRRQSLPEEYKFSISHRAEGLEQMPQGQAWGNLSMAWQFLLIERAEEAHECARFAYQAAEIALEREAFWPFFAPMAQRDPHLRRLNNLSGQMACLEHQFYARWILEGEAPLDLLHQSLNGWHSSREEKPQWFPDTTVLLNCVLTERWEDALWQSKVAARRNGLRLHSADEVARPPRGEVATLALLTEVALGNTTESARILSERSVANWCSRSRNWPRNVVGLSVRERVAWFYLWHRHFASQLPPLEEMLRDLRAE